MSWVWKACGIYMTYQRSVKCSSYSPFSYFLWKMSLSQSSPFHIKLNFVHYTRVTSSISTKLQSITVHCNLEMLWGVLLIYRESTGDIVHVYKKLHNRLTSTISQQSTEYQCRKFSVQCQHWPEVETATRHKKITTHDKMHLGLILPGPAPRIG